MCGNILARHGVCLEVTCMKRSHGDEHKVTEKSTQQREEKSFEGPFQSTCRNGALA
jgi:hypothetical protein